MEAQFTAVEFDMAMEDLRAKRNNLLKDTDHLALSDQTLSDDISIGQSLDMHFNMNGFYNKS